MGEPLVIDQTCSTAEQCRRAGIAVGDTIQGREEERNGYFHEARLTLLWLGLHVAVWSATERDTHDGEWSEPEELSDWSLDCRKWHKVTP